jgi:hypothetical protein
MNDLHLCSQCKHHAPPNECRHPSAVDLVDGTPADCHMQRYDAPEDEQESCGRDGKWFEVRPAPPKKRGSTKPPLKTLRRVKPLRKPVAS